MQFLIIRTSSLGDVLQAFDALSYLRDLHPDAAIDWVVDESFREIVAVHPSVRHAIAIDLRGMKRNWRSFSWWIRLVRSFSRLRQVRYDALFDLQANSKSGLITLLARAKDKVGFGRKSVREWPNLLATSIRFDVPKSLPIRLYYADLLRQFFRQEADFTPSIPPRRTPQGSLKIMACPGSRWINKQLPPAAFAAFLRLIRDAVPSSFLLVWGTEAEREACQEIARLLGGGELAAPLPLPRWQSLMAECDLVIAVDSAALHLAATTATPSFSIFGPTLAKTFKPLGPAHGAFQGQCPYGQPFKKQCPLLRSCKTGACIRSLDPQELFQAFYAWWTVFNSVSKST